MSLGTYRLAKVKKDIRRISAQLAKATTAAEGASDYLKSAADQLDAQASHLRMIAQEIKNLGAESN